MEFLFLLSLAFLLYWYFTRSKRSASPIRIGDVVQVQEMHRVDRDFPLGNFGAVCKLNGRVQVVFPNLTSRGEVDYVYRWYDRKAVRKPISKQKIDQERLTKATYIAALIEEQVELEPEIATLKDHCQELNERIQLAANSQVFADYRQDFANRLSSAQQFLVEAERLSQSSLQFVRELLIGSELEEYDANLRRVDYSNLLSQYRTLRRDYQDIQSDLESSGYPELPRD